MGSPFGAIGPPARAGRLQTTNESATTNAPLNRNTEEDFRIDGVALDERARLAIEQPVVDGTRAHVRAAVARHVEQAAARANLVVVVVAAGHERVPIEDADVRLEHRHEVKDVFGFGTQAV